MNSYELSRNWFDFSFSNPDLIKPIHSAIYFFAIEHCNRLGWKDKFGFPSQMVMEAIGVKNWRTYSSALSELVDWEFIKMIEISKNQYSANVIAIVKNTKAKSKALDKALQKHSTKHSQKQGQSIVSIDKQLNNQQQTIEQLNNDFLETDNKIDFDFFWNLYDKKVGDLKKCKKKWDGFDFEKQSKILHHVEKYVQSTPDKKFRANPETYFNQERWLNEIIIENNGSNKGNNAKGGVTNEELAKIFFDHAVKQREQNGSN